MSSSSAELSSCLSQNASAGAPRPDMNVAQMRWGASLFTFYLLAAALSHGAPRHTPARGDRTQAHRAIASHERLDEQQIFHSRYEDGLIRTHPCQLNRPITKEEQLAEFHSGRRRHHPRCFVTDDLDRTADWLGELLNVPAGPVGTPRPDPNALYKSESEAFTCRNPFHRARGDGYRDYRARLRKERVARRP